jgi:release factor glutamine methyltransferase
VTVAEALREGERRLQAAGVVHARLDAEQLLRHVTGRDRARLLVDAAAQVPAEQESGFFSLIAARATRRPLQHLTGVQAFWHQELAVSPAVLIPRPETEILVEAALARLADVPSPLVADVGTGSGCIAVAIATTRPDARVVATDISPEALSVARANAAANRVSIDFRSGDLLEPTAGWAPLHAVLSNPPYIGEDERAALEPEVRDYEPALALFAPGERYSVYRRLAPIAYTRLGSGGWLLVEVGMGMANEVSRIFVAAGFAIDAVLADLQAIDRVVVARRS